LGIIVAVRRSSFFSVALHQPVRCSDACSLRRPRSATQLNVGKRRASKGVTKTIRRFMASALKAARFRSSNLAHQARFGGPFDQSLWPEIPLHIGRQERKRAGAVVSSAGSTMLQQARMLCRAGTPRRLAHAKPPTAGGPCASPARRRQPPTSPGCPRRMHDHRKLAGGRNGCLAMAHAPGDQQTTGLSLRLDGIRDDLRARATATVEGGASRHEVEALF
jgi:hypothetical protein